MNCQLMMTASPRSLRGTDTVRTAIAALMQEKVSALPVVDAQDRYLGVISVRGLIGLALPRIARSNSTMQDLAFLHESLPDIRRRLGENADQPLAKLLDAEAPTAELDSSLIEAMLHFYRGHSLVPVIDAETRKVLGVISRTDALRTLAEGL